MKAEYSVRSSKLKFQTDPKSGAKVKKEWDQISKFASMWIFVFKPKLLAIYFFFLKSDLQKNKYSHNQSQNELGVNCLSSLKFQ